jgi:CRISPR-associated exonuclease Cas4
MVDVYLPLAYLNAWEYCPRRFYLEYEFGEMQDNAHIVMEGQGPILNRLCQLILKTLKSVTGTNQEKSVWIVRI